MLAARRDGIAFEPHLVPLSDFLSRPRAADATKGIKLYKSVGAALQDLVIAAMCVGRARDASVGTALPVSIAPVLK
jgi:alanine dehydrogenase